MYKLFIIISIAFIGAGLINKEKNTADSYVLSPSISQPKELGKVQWLRDINDATKLSAKTQKPIFLLFQEVPGCATCQNYGQNVLSHPLIVEAIETHFVPLAIFNNKGGKDREVLNYFKEPTWNNPVVRIVNHKKENLINRISGNYSALGVVEAMVSILENDKKKIPAYLSLLQKELAADQLGTETTYLSMYCFWTGEKKIADIDGVVETHAGFMNGREVVKVEYAPEVVPFDNLVKQARTKSCASHIYTEDLNQQLTAEKILGSEYVSEKGKFRLDPETKYYLYKSHYKYLPMTNLQAVKANSLIGKGQSPNEVFSSRQLKLLDYIQNHPSKKWKSVINKDLITAWKLVEKIKQA